MGVTSDGQRGGGLSSLGYTPKLYVLGTGCASTLRASKSASLASTAKPYTACICARPPPLVVFPQITVLADAHSLAVIQNPLNVSGQCRGGQQGLYFDNPRSKPIHSTQLSAFFDGAQRVSTPRPWHPEGPHVDSTRTLSRVVLLAGPHDGSVHICGRCSRLNPPSIEQWIVGPHKHIRRDPIPLGDRC